MAIWDSLTGRRSEKSTSADSPDASFPTSSFTTPQPESADNTASDLTEAPSLDSATSSTSASSTKSPPPYPYLFPALSGLNSPQAPAGLDYLNLEDSLLSDLPGSRSALPSRGWADDLCYGTGVTYLTALSIGGAWGLSEGLRRSPPNAPPKLRVNSALNAITRRGPFLGNSAGVLALVYNGVNSTIGYYRGRHDSLNSVLAGGFSGMLFKSTRGVKPMLISGGLVASAAGTWAGARKILFA